MISEIIIIIIILIYCFSYYKEIYNIFKTYQDDSNNNVIGVCKRLYIDKDNKEISIIKNLVDKKFCNNLIKSGENYAIING
jgi:hypothetical protein